MLHLVSIQYSYGVAVCNADHAAVDSSGMASQPKQHGEYRREVIHWSILPAPVKRKPARGGLWLTRVLNAEVTAVSAAAHECNALLQRHSLQSMLWRGLLESLHVDHKKITEQASGILRDVKVVAVVLY